MGTKWPRHLSSRGRQALRRDSTHGPCGSQGAGRRRKPLAHVWPDTIHACTDTGGTGFGFVPGAWIARPDPQPRLCSAYPAWFHFCASGPASFLHMAACVPQGGGTPPAVTCPLPITLKGFWDFAVSGDVVLISSYALALLKRGPVESGIQLRLRFWRRPVLTFLLIRVNLTGTRGPSWS